jgi:leader peptidase (prepilin peptidase) / N-methyltransferase
MPLPLCMAAVFLVGVCLGALVNWAIYTLAWRPRWISPWSPLPPECSPRRGLDCIPLLGWFSLWREASVHGRGFWVRPLLLEMGVGFALAALYWWEVVRLGLIEPQIGAGIAPPSWVLHWQFASHALLLCWMLAASFIDIDEKIIPDAITVTGTLLGLTLATLVPMSLLPHVAQRVAPPHLGVPLLPPLWLEPMTVVAPAEWPPDWGRPRDWPSLAIGLGCYWLWCFALAPRIWRGRRGVGFALRLIVARVRRELSRPPLSWLLVAGTLAILAVWWFGEAAWAGMLTALVGLVLSGGIVWAVRLIGSAALRREAMGFGDVTLMMMIGTFLGWQASLITFFLAPFAGLFIGLVQFISRRDDVIPYGPFLCLAAAAVVVFWAPIWIWAQPLFDAGALVPLVLVVCLVMLGVMLALWRMIKGLLFGDGDIH